MNVYLIVYMVLDSYLNNLSSFQIFWIVFPCQTQESVKFLIFIKFYLIFGRKFTFQILPYHSSLCNFTYNVSLNPMFKMTLFTDFYRCLLCRYCKVNEYLSTGPSEEERVKIFWV